ncbi:MAG TPA: GNAT family N-acetyltransferase [Candidatus Nitrosotalea sp.]|nr:GNAT family N-acetyltransferase [Candidatus Nitrosotalea sp.]
MRFFHPVPHLSLAGSADAPALSRLYEESWLDSGDPLDAGLLDLMRPLPGEVAAWMRGGFEIYRAEYQGHLAGAVRCSFPTSTCHVDGLVVAPAQRRRGIGRQIAEHALDRARRAGVTRVWTEASPQLAAALALFHSLGFKESVRIDGPPFRQPLVLLEMSI